MVGAMGTRRLPTTTVPREKWSFKSLFSPEFESSIIEKKYLLRYLKIIYPTNHRLLVIILISHALINSIELTIFNTLPKQAKIIHLTLLAISIALNLLSLIVVPRLPNRILSNLISLICLCPLAILSCLYPSECHIYLLLILVYTLASLSLISSVSISISIIVIISIFTLASKFYLILFLISNMIGMYLNRLLDITMRSAYKQLCQSKFH